ncbi:MAG: metallophosphoesterase [Sedimentisphaerales bacterium]|nr:metallophosphoesterase [Sedimentisphaerales bacterium]
MRKSEEQSTKRKELADQGIYLKGLALGSLGFCTRSAVDVNGGGAEWLEVVEMDLNLTKRHHRLHGTRIIHVSDLHLSRTVKADYLTRCIERINLLEADIVLLTGDYITYDILGKYRKKVAGLLGGIKSRFGAFACLGNHDYGVKVMMPRKRNYMLLEFISDLKGNGINVLRNESALLDIHGEKLRLVGLGDLKAGDFHPQKAFADASNGDVTVALIHNPKGAEYLDEFDVDAVFSGHTHGKISRFPHTHLLNIKKRKFHAGMYKVNDTVLYVNRGLGRVGRMRFYARPEITILTLR